MAPEEIADILQKTFGGGIADVHMGGGHPHAVVESGSLRAVSTFLRDDPRMGFNMLRSITALDMLADNRFVLVYDLLAVALDRGDKLVTDTQEFALHVRTDRANPKVPSVADIWAAADWHEREVMDLMGVHIEHHPDPRRILLPDDWVGHPLRKDYEFPMEYHGIPATTEYDLPNPVH